MVVDRLRDELQAVGPDALELGRERRVLDANANLPSGLEHPKHEVRCLGGALDDDHPRRVGDHPTSPAEAVGQGQAQRELTERFPIVEHPRRRAPRRLLVRRQPFPHRKQRCVGNGRHEVVGWGGTHDLGLRPRRGQRSHRADDGREPRPRDHVPLGDQLLVDVADHPAGQTDLAGEDARSGQRHARPQRFGADRVQQRPAKSEAEGLFALRRERQPRQVVSLFGQRTRRPWCSMSAST